MMGQTLETLKVKLFTDGADKAQIVEMARQPWIVGFTTNPSLLKKAGVSDQITTIGGIVAHAGLFQQRGVRGKPNNPWLPGHLHDLRLVGAIGEELDLQCFQGLTHHTRPTLLSSHVAAHYTA